MPRYRIILTLLIASNFVSYLIRAIGKQKTASHARSNWIAEFLIACFLGTTAMAQETPLSRPELDKGPTIVKTHIFLADIDSVDTPDQSFEANVFFEFQWKDARLAHDGEGFVNYELDEIWHPRIEIVNRQKVWSLLEPSLEVDGEGMVTLMIWYWGHFSQPMDLVDFPFDEHNFKIRVLAVGYRENTIRFEEDTDKPSGIAKKLSVADWHKIHGSLVVEPYVPRPGGPSVASVVYRFHAKRRTEYYWVKIIFPLILIVAMSWVVFWIDPIESGTQIGVTMTAMLTLIAYRFALGAELPNLSYMSRLDYLVLAATVLVFMSVPEVLITSTLAMKERLELARRIDWWARIIFPCVFALFLLDALVFRLLV